MSIFSPGPEDNNPVPGNTLLPIRIKEEPLDIEEMNLDNLTSSVSRSQRGLSIVNLFVVDCRLL